MANELVDDIKEPDDVLRLLEELRQDYEQRAAPYHDIAVRNRRYLHGDQFDDLNDRRTTVVDRRRGPSWRPAAPKATRNYMRKLRSTWAARMTEEAPFARAYANDSSGFDSAAQQVANGWLEYAYANVSWQKKLFRAAMIVQSDGAVHFKSTWDPEAGGISKITGERMGAISCEVFDIFSCGIQEEEPEHAQWCYFERIVDRWEARAILRDAGIDEEPKSDAFRYPSGRKEENGYRVHEIWYRPGARFRDGLYAVVCGGHVVDARAYPYQHGQLPLSTWRLEPKDGTPWGDTHVNDAVPVQEHVNGIFSAIVRLTHDVSDMRLLAKPEITNKLQNKNHWINVDDVETIQKGWAWMAPPDPPRMLFDQLPEGVSALHDLYGQNELLVGRTGDGDAAGKTIAFMNRLDGLALKGPKNELDQANVRTAKQWLYLSQQFVEEPRWIQVLGPDKRPYAVAFSGADLEGTDVRIEPAEGTTLTQAGEAERAREEVELGVTPPGEALERAETGLSETRFSAATVNLVNNQIEAALQGQPVPADSTIDPRAAVDTIVQRVSFEMSQGRPPADPGLQNLLRLLAEYRSVIARAQSGAQGGQAARKQGFVQGQQSNAERELPAGPG